MQFKLIFIVFLPDFLFYIILSSKMLSMRLLVFKKLILNLII